MIEVTVQLFGAFRKYEQRGVPLILRMEEPTRVADVKTALFQKWGESESLLWDSALADGTHILASDQILSRSCVVSILPPVCGG